MSKKVWMQVVRKPRPAKPAEAEKAKIIAACEAFIRDVLKPRFLPQIKPAEFNYPVEIFGAWRAGRYRFMTTQEVKRDIGILPLALTILAIDDFTFGGMHFQPALRETSLKLYL